MESLPRSRRALIDYYDPPVVRFTNDYLKRLLIERHYIRARIENPGGSVILMGVAATTEQMSEYSASIGNAFHLDLIGAEQFVAKLSEGDQLTLMQWVDGLTSHQAASFSSVTPASIRQRRHRIVKRLGKELADGDAGTAG